MSLWQASLIGIFAYLGRNQVPWFFGTTGGWYGIGRPLVAGGICGFILGDIYLGIFCGILIQALYIGQITPGSAMHSDVNLASFVGISIAISSHTHPEVAVMLAIPLGLLGVYLNQLTMSAQVCFSKKAMTYAETGDARKIRWINICGTSISFLERFSVVLLLCYFGSPVITKVLEIVPEVVVYFLVISGRVIPLIGFSMLLNQIINEGWMMVLFLFGWLMCFIFKLSMLHLILVAFFISIIYLLAYTKGCSETILVQQDTLQRNNIEEEGDYEE
ncbi:PTS mannose/fructose/sorbose/N-acetylgalactosamine transporter subunit IIC [Vagococcus humatus]|uniref:PTS sugar transporter subunit IIC n=1 Tax=Vagococcus humatus TaxID=1889241 RepID=A0A429Z5X5_9ENTE|nr:PTS sugar transporter subunit IIC [Vagococcus humatus]RST89078.1 PTS sugar transporter subunit IIC [Vagococcus humatus]